MEERIKQLENKVTELQNKINHLNDYSTIPLEVEKALIARGFASSKDKDSVTYALQAKGGTSHTYYVAAISSGATTTAITITDGVITS